MTDKKRDAYHYKGCGLDNVYLISGYEIVENGEGVIIHNMDGLHRAIARHLVDEQKTLCGKEIRYLRIYLDLTQSRLGKLLGVDSQMIARYEKDQNSIPAPTDRLFRAIVLEHITGHINVQDLISKIEDMEDGIDKQHQFKVSGKKWKVA